MGGIINTSDAVEFFLAGATAVSVGTANFINPRATIEIIQGLKDYLAKNKFKSIRQVIGKLKT
jgi:dihydroorotate dehydrogenase (NAD+) catalytic subunit